MISNWNISSILPSVRYSVASVPGCVADSVRTVKSGLVGVRLIPRWRNCRSYTDVDRGRQRKVALHRQLVRRVHSQIVGHLSVDLVQRLPRVGERFAGKQQRQGPVVQKDLDRKSVV